MVLGQPGLHSRVLAGAADVADDVQLDLAKLDPRLGDKSLLRLVGRASSAGDQTIELFKYQLTVGAHLRHHATTVDAVSRLRAPNPKFQRTWLWPA